MKKLITLLFAAGLATVAFAQPGYRNDSRNYDNSYQSSPYSNNDQYRNDDRYDRDRGYHNQYESRRQRLARERYEYEMMMRRRQAALYHQRMYDSYYPYGTSRPSLQIRIGIGGRSRY